MIRGIVALIGRPNVGKSTLFNAMSGKRDAIVDDRPGVTRDRLYTVVDRGEGHPFILVDTGGFETKDMYYQPFEKNIVWQQTEYAIQEADLVVMLLDGKTGLHPYDRELVRYLQKLQKEVVFVVNKIDGYEQEAQMFEFAELGIDGMLPLSAAHNRGVGELRENIQERLAAQEALSERKTPEKGAVGIALIGKPNVGKSSLLNRLTGEERALVSDVAGTTRDTVDTPFKYKGKPYVIVDTAGIRRKSKVTEKLESLSVLKSLRAIERSDVVLLVISADEGLSEQDAKLASLVLKQHKPLLIVVNKWDLIEEKDANTAREYAADIRYKIKSMAYVPVKFVSCEKNQRVFKLFENIEALAEQFRKRVPTGELNRALEETVQNHTPALVRNYKKRPKFYYATQVRAEPPTIVIMCNVADEIQESYKRYMEHQMRAQLGFTDIPIRLIFRGKIEATQKRGKVPDFLAGVID